MKHIMTRAIAICLLLVATSVFLANKRKTEVAVTRTTFASFPMNIEPWKAVNAPPLDEEIVKVLGVDEYLSRVYYKADGAHVGLYMGYYASQRQGDTIHSPLNCLPGAGWEPISEGRLTIPNIDGNGRSITVNRYVVQKGLDRQMVLYWYQSHGRVVASEYTSKAYLIQDAIRLNRTDGSMLRVIAPIDTRAEGNTANAEQLAAEFVRAIFPLLPPYLPE
ncbi:MAG TPA: EpsI family protein [Vicinamibacterales bacterium]|nr:EpsI family protein [Vicinamibacterales bacterium]